MVGSVAFNTLKTPFGERQKILGGAATYFSLSASYFTDVRVVGVVGEDFTAENEEVMKKRGVDTRGIQHAKGKTFHWTGEYGENVNEAKTLNTELNVFETFQPSIPAEYNNSDYLYAKIYCAGYSDWKDNIYIGQNSDSAPAAASLGNDLWIAFIGQLTGHIELVVEQWQQVVRQQYRHIGASPR